MPTIQQPYRKTSNMFLCIVKRPDVSGMAYMDKGKVVRFPDRWDVWKVLADSHEQAMKEAKYHFYHSKDEQILISDSPLKSKK